VLFAQSLVEFAHSAAGIPRPLHQKLHPGREVQASAADNRAGGRRALPDLHHLQRKIGSDRMAAWTLLHSLNGQVSGPGGSSKRALWTVWPGG
jgi:hypothetical protein